MASSGGGGGSGSLQFAPSDPSRGDSSQGALVSDHWQVKQRVNFPTLAEYRNNDRYVVFGEFDLPVKQSQSALEQKRPLKAVSNSSSTQVTQWLFGSISDRSIPRKLDVPDLESQSQSLRLVDGYFAELS